MVKFCGDPWSWSGVGSSLEFRGAEVEFRGVWTRVEWSSDFRSPRQRALPLQPIGDELDDQTRDENGSPSSVLTGPRPLRPLALLKNAI